MMKFVAKLLLKKVAGNKIKHINTIKKFIDDHKKGKKVPVKQAINAVCAVIGLI